MFSLFSLALGGSAIYAGITSLQKNKRTSLIEALSAPEPVVTQPGLQTRMVALQNEIKENVSALDHQYQCFIQKNVDPLLGKQRLAQMKEILSAEALALTDEERYANQRLGFGGLALGFALLGQFVYAPLSLLAILIGLALIGNVYLYAYLEWQRTRRLGALHLTCIYLAFLWLGGYAAIGALGAVLMGVSLKVKALTEKQSQNNLVDIFQLRPSKVWVRSNGAEIEIPFEQLKVGDTLVLQAGQVVPVDGTIAVGLATVDQHMLTGEAQPVEKHKGDSILASTVLLSGKVDIIVEKTGAATTAGQIGEILNQTAQYNSSTALKVVELTDRFTWPTVALSALSWPLIGPAGAISLLGANSTFNTWVSGPLAILNFLNIAANARILIKDGGALERLNEVDTIVFDKTGTLTLEQPQVTQVFPVNGMSETAVLMLAAAAEARQTHPIARAILDAAVELGIQLPAIDEAHYEVGYGLKVRLVNDDMLAKWPDNKLADGVTEAHSSAATPTIRVGSERFMAMQGVVMPRQVAEVTEACQAQGHSLVMVALDDMLVGCIELQPTLRPEARPIIAGLHEQGLQLYIISGDQEAPTRKLAHDLGMTGYFANILPDGKAALIEQLQQAGHRVCFIGDGINDAIAMRKADVSISLRGATTVATDTAQIILMEGNLNQLLYLLQLAAEFEHNLKRNFRFTAVVSLVATAGILLVGFTFAATEIFYTISLLGGLGIAMKPLLDHQNEAETENL